MVQSKTRSKDLKIQRIQGCILKAVGVISKVTDTLINLKYDKNLSPNNMRKSLGPMVHDCNDFLALHSHVNSRLEETHRDNIVHRLDSQYHTLKKNVSSESEFLFGDALLKRVINITTNKTLFDCIYTERTKLNSMNYAYFRNMFICFEF